MARPREFEEVEAIRKAQDVFWQHGYQDASLADLLDGMGLTRGSLYKAFKDKKHLYLRVLESYEQSAVDVAVALLSNGDEADGSARILNLFEGIYAASLRGEQWGCLLCTATSGTEMNDPEIAAAVKSGLVKMQGGFVQALLGSPAHQSLSLEEKTHLADVLLTQYIGVRMLVRSRLPLGVVENSAKGVAAILGVSPR